MKQQRAKLRALIRGQQQPGDTQHASYADAAQPLPKRPHLEPTSQRDIEREVVSLRWSMHQAQALALSSQQHTPQQCMPSTEQLVAAVAELEHRCTTATRDHRPPMDCVPASTPAVLGRVLSHVACGRALRHLQSRASRLHTLAQLAATHGLANACHMLARRADALDLLLASAQHGGEGGRGVQPSSSDDDGGGGGGEEEEEEARGDGCEAGHGQEDGGIAGSSAAGTGGAGAGGEREDEEKRRGERVEARATASNHSTEIGVSGGGGGGGASGSHSQQSNLGHRDSAATRDGARDASPHSHNTSTEDSTINNNSSSSGSHSHSHSHNHSSDSSSGSSVMHGGQEMNARHRHRDDDRSKRSHLDVTVGHGPDAPSSSQSHSIPCSQPPPPPVNTTATSATEHAEGACGPQRPHGASVGEPRGGFSDGAEVGAMLGAVVQGASSPASSPLATGQRAGVPHPRARSTGGCCGSKHGQAQPHMAQAARFKTRVVGTQPLKCVRAPVVRGGKLLADTRAWYNDVVIRCLEAVAAVYDGAGNTKATGAQGQTRVQFMRRVAEKGEAHGDWGHVATRGGHVHAGGDDDDDDDDEGEEGEARHSAGVDGPDSADLAEDTMGQGSDDNNNSSDSTHACSGNNNGDNNGTGSKKQRGQEPPPRSAHQQLHHGDLERSTVNGVTPASLSEVAAGASDCCVGDESFVLSQASIAASARVLDSLARARALHGVTSCLCSAALVMQWVWHDATTPHT